MSGEKSQNCLILHIKGLAVREDIRKCHDQPFEQGDLFFESGGKNNIVGPDETEPCTCLVRQH